MIVDNVGNSLAPMTFAAVNVADTSLFAESLTDLKRVSKKAGIDLQGSVLNADAGFDSKKNCKRSWNQGLKPNLKKTNVTARESSGEERDFSTSNCTNPGL